MTRCEKIKFSDSNGGIIYKEYPVANPEEVFKYYIRKFLNDKVKDLWVYNKISTQQYHSEKGKIRGRKSDFKEIINFLCKYYTEEEILERHSYYYNLSYDNTFINFFGGYMMKKNEDRD